MRLNSVARDGCTHMVPKSTTSVGTVRLYSIEFCTVDYRIVSGFSHIIVPFDGYDPLFSSDESDPGRHFCQENVILSLEHSLHQDAGCYSGTELDYLSWSSSIFIAYYLAFSIQVKVTD